MQFRYSLSYQITKITRCSHKMAMDFCLNGKVQVNQLVETNPRRTIGYHEQIQINGQVVREGTPLKYVLLYKPNLYECTANRQIENHIYEILPPSYQDLFALGRLDKNSEGLLLLTNDGQMYREMMNHESSIEKEYLVQTFHPITTSLAESFINPFQLGQRHTLPAKFEKVDDFSFNDIEVAFVDYSKMSSYDQLHGDFIPNVSIIDMVFNVASGYSKLIEIDTFVP